MSIVQMCSAAEVSRASFYRHRNAPEAEDRDMELRDGIQKIALEMPCYGRRRITAELRRALGRVLLRHDEIYRADVVIFEARGGVPPSVGSGPG